MTVAGQGRREATPLSRGASLTTLQSEAGTSRHLREPTAELASPSVVTLPPGLNALRSDRAAHSLALPGGRLRQAHTV